MSLITRVLLLALAVPFVLANSSNCGSGQFGWGRKDCCLPTGGPKNPSNPPSGKDCPSNWSWNDGLGCCAPHQPTNNSPPPQCHNGWNWSDNSLCCNPPTTPTNPSNPSNPSSKPGGYPYDDKNPRHKRFPTEKRQLRSRIFVPCPKGLSACPVSGLIGGEYECVNTLVDLDNCGGCTTLSEGQNCNAISGVWNVGCEQSACKIYTCADGYMLSTDGKSCNPL